ncbi:hypothetical protein B0J13DRAFT_644541 [Dactylonectria estremocensis]|uniref:Uncharacterized protein n=1 Tax=Dactylonectria estremocensis TaxID=1079267 RepID=A0A9P9IRD9_9HYPO|nr:hypothetical protein B0J13DRAFT_644541 [Dactylonectria estremocensis]
MQCLALLLLALGNVAFAAECFNDQKRTTNTPNGGQIRAAITSHNSLDTICAGSWRVGDEEQLENTFNHGSLLLSVQRTDKSVPLKHCMGAFDNIISQCIEGAGLWGGYWTYEGEVYNISNLDYPHNPLLPQDEGGPGNLEPNSGLCDLPKSNAATFADSGAAQYLQDFLSGNGDDNWLTAMERATTNGQGTAEEPSCGVIESANCYPFKDCREFTPTEFYYVRLVSGLINQFFTRAHEKFQDETIRNILAINDIIADFRPDPAHTIDPNIFRTAGGAASMADKIIKLGQNRALGPLADFLGLIGAIMGIVGGNLPGSEVFDIEAVRNEAVAHLKKVFEETNKSMANLLARLFGNKNIDYSLSGLVDGMKRGGIQLVADDWDPTAIILSMAWMGDSESVDLTDSLSEAVRQMNQGLVGAILKAMGRLVLVIKDLDQTGYSMTGAQFIDNECYMISKGWLDGQYAYMDEEDIKLLPEKYGFDMVEFYKNAKECSTLDIDGADPSVGSSTAYPACFFNLDFKETYTYCKHHSCEDDKDCESECFDGCDYRFEFMTGVCRLKE